MKSVMSMTTCIPVKKMAFEVQNVALTGAMSAADAAGFGCGCACRTGFMVEGHTRGGAQEEAQIAGGLAQFNPVPDYLCCVMHRDRLSSHDRPRRARRCQRHHGILAISQLEWRRSNHWFQLRFKKGSHCRKFRYRMSI